MKNKIANILKEYTKKHGISASSVILEEYAEELIKHGCSIRDESRYIELPCAVGDTVYMRFEGKITSFLITHVFAEQKINEEVIKCYAAKGNKVSTGFSANHIGKTVFLTKEEAEQALKGGDNNEKS